MRMSFGRSRPNCSAASAARYSSTYFLLSNMFLHSTENHHSDAMHMKISTYAVPASSAAPV